MATWVSCARLALSGERDLDGAAPLGVIQNGTWVDLRLVVGHPTRNVKLLVDYEGDLPVVVKDARI